MTDEAKAWVYRAGVVLAVLGFATLHVYRTAAAAAYAAGLLCLALSFDYTKARERSINLGGLALLGGAIAIRLTRPEWTWWAIGLWAAGLAALGAGAWTEIQQRWAASRQFLLEVRNEMQRVTWPSGREVYATTVVVILVSAFFGVFIWVIDIALNQAVGRIFKFFGAV